MERDNDDFLEANAKRLELERDHYKVESGLWKYAADTRLSEIRKTGSIRCESCGKTVAEHTNLLHCHVAPPLATGVSDLLELLDELHHAIVWSSTTTKREQDQFDSIMSQIKKRLTS